MPVPPKRPAQYSSPGVRIVRQTPNSQLAPSVVQTPPLLKPPVKPAQGPPNTKPRPAVKQVQKPLDLDLSEMDMALEKNAVPTDKPKEKAAEPIQSAATGTASTQALPEDELVKVVGTKYDKLNALWNKAEDSLKKFLVPHWVEHCYSSFVDDSEPDHVQHGLSTYKCLSWAKFNGTWRLCYEVYDDYHPDRRYTRPVTECSADIRLSLVRHFPCLREKVLEAAQKNLQSLDKAIADFSAFLN